MKKNISTHGDPNGKVASHNPFAKVKIIKQLGKIIVCTECGQQQPKRRCYRCGDIRCLDCLAMIHGKEFCFDCADRVMIASVWRDESNRGIL